MKEAPLSPSALGRVVLLSNRPTEGVHVPVEWLELCPERGILGDRWAATAWLRRPDGTSDPRVQVSVTHYQTMARLIGSEERVRDCGDNVFVDFDLSEANLPAGTLFQMGSAVLEVSDVYNDACGKFIQRFGKEAFDCVRDPANRPLRLRGIFCRILQAGTVRLGDVVMRV